MRFYVNIARFHVIFYAMRSSITVSPLPSGTMEAFDALFLATKEPLEEKEIVSYLDEVGIKEGKYPFLICLLILTYNLGGIDKGSFDDRVKTKVFGDIVVYYPANVSSGTQKRDNVDEKLMGMLREWGEQD